jgi:hypothetical protein
MMGVAVRFAVCLWVAAALLGGDPARGTELWESDDGDWAWEGGGFLKAQGMGMGFRGIDLYEGLTGADRAGMQTTKLRLGTDLYWRDLRLGAQHELRMTVFSRGMDFGTAMPGFGSTQSDRPRLWSIPDVDGAGLLLQNDLDRYYLKAALGPVDLTVGRQAISWGSAWFWKPTDRWSPFSPMDIDPDVKRGVDAVRGEIFLGQRTSLDLIVTFERHEDATREYWFHGGARFRTGFGRWDLAVSVARFQLSRDGNWMVGLETTGELGKVGVRAEVAANVNEDAEDWDIQGVIGADYHFPIKLTLAGEFFYNGYGTDDTDDYTSYYFDPANPLISPLKSERLLRGEAFNIGRYYLGVSLSQEVHPLVHLSLASITNLLDPSGMLIAGIQWSVVQDAKVKAGAMIPLGKKPKGLSIESEYGAMPVAGYIVMKLSF